MSNLSINKEVPITGLINESINSNEPANYIMGYNSLDNNKNTKEIGNQNHSMSNTVERVIINPDTRSFNDSPSLNNIKIPEDLVLKLNQEIHQSLLPSNLENTIVNNIGESSRREVSSLENSVYPIQNVNTYSSNEFDDLKSIQNQNKDYMKTSFRMKKNDSSNNSSNTNLFLKKVVNSLLSENNEKPKSLINPSLAMSKNKSVSSPGLSNFYTFSSHNTSNGMKSSVSSTLSSPSIENAVIINTSPINKQNNKGSTLSFPFLSFKSLFSSEGKNKSEPTTHESSIVDDDKNSSFLPNQSIKNLKEIQSKMEHNQSSSSKDTNSSKPSKGKKSSFNSRINFQSFLNVFNNLSDYAKSQQSQDNDGQGNKKRFVASNTLTLNVPGADEISPTSDQDFYGHSIPTSSSPLMASLPLLSNGNSFVVLPPLSRHSSVSRHSSFSYHIPQQLPHDDNDDKDSNDNDNDNIEAKLPPTSLTPEKESKIDKSNAYSSSNSSSNNSHSVESDAEINSPRFYNQSITGKPICIPYKASSLSPNIQYTDIAPQNKFLSSIIQTRDRSNSVSSCSSFSSIKDTLNIDTIHEEHEEETEEENKKSKPIYRSSSLRPPNKTYKSASIPIIISNDSTAPSAPSAPAAPPATSNINIQDRRITRHKKYYSQSNVMNPPAYIHHSIPAYNITSAPTINRERNNSFSRGPFSSYSNIFSSSNLNQVNSLASDDDSEDEKANHSFIKSSASLISSLVNAEAEKKDDQRNKSSVFDPEFIEKVRAKAVMQHRQSILFHEHDKKFVMEPCSFNSIIPEPEKLRLLNPVYVRTQYLEQLHSGGATRPMTLKEMEQKGVVSPDQILDTITAEKLRFHLPRRYRDHPTWELIYSLSDHGYSFLTVYDKIADKGPLLLVIKDTQDQVFGAYLSESVHVSNRFYGSGECFLWRKGDHQRSFKVYEWSGLNELNMLTSRDTIAFGGGKQGRFGLSLDQDMEGGTTAYCDTFKNDPLTIPSRVDRFKPQTLPTYYETPNITFECVNIEFWKVTDEECRCNW